MKSAETCSYSLCNKLYTYLYHHIVVLDKYIHSNLVYCKHDYNVSSEIFYVLTNGNRNTANPRRRSTFTTVNPPTVDYLLIPSFANNKGDARFHVWFRARLKILLTVFCVLCRHHRKFDYITSLLRWLVSTVGKLKTTFAPSFNCNANSITSLRSCSLTEYSCWGAMHSPFATVEPSAYGHIKFIMKWTMNNKELIFSHILILFICFFSGPLICIVNLSI